MIQSWGYRQLSAMFNATQSVNVQCNTISQNIICQSYHLIILYIFGNKPDITKIWLKHIIHRILCRCIICPLWKKTEDLSDHINITYVSSIINIIPHSISLFSISHLQTISYYTISGCVMGSNYIRLNWDNWSTDSY